MTALATKSETSRRKEAIRLVFSITGLYACYIYYGWIQERLHKTTYGPNNDKFHSPALLIFIQVLINAILGVFSVVSNGDSLYRGVPVKAFIGMSLSYVVAMYTSNKSLEFVDYPTQVVLKSVKMIPVLLGGVLFLGKRYPRNEYVEVAVITLGITLFVFRGDKAAKSAAASNGDGVGLDWTYLQGLALASVSLLCDGFTGTLQERVRGTHRPTGPQFMLYMNLWSSLLFFFPLALSGEMVSGTQFLVTHPGALADVLLFGVTSALGQLFIFSVLAGFGPLVLTMATTTRKCFSILLSVVFFGHPLGLRQWFGAALVFAGLFAHTLGKWRKAGGGAASAAAKGAKAS